MRVSFIIPIYNVAQYIEECVNSLLRQSYRDFEIILVDDGSTDASPLICDSISNNDSRVSVIHKSNGGLSDARNAGLTAAKGEYVVFVDGDDFWRDKDSLSNLLNVANNYSEADFIGYNCEYFFPNTNQYQAWIPYSKSLSAPVDGNTAMVALVKSGTFPMSACLKLIKRSFLLNNDITFRVGTISEDIPWFINVLEKTNSCLFINQYVYAYRQNVSGSISNTGGERFFQHIFAIIKDELEKMDSRKFSLEAKNALMSFLAYEYSIMISSLYRLDEGKRQEYRRQLYPYAYLLRYTDNPKVKRASVIYRLFGIRVTELALRRYKKMRNKKWKKR